MPSLNDLINSVWESLAPGQHVNAKETAYWKSKTASPNAADGLADAKRRYFVEQGLAANSNNDNEREYWKNRCTALGLGLPGNFTLNDYKFAALSNGG